MSIRIERAANGYIVHRMGGILTSDDLKRPMVFDSLERLVDWLRVQYGERRNPVCGPFEAAPKAVLRADNLDPVQGY